MAEPHNPGVAEATPVWALPRSLAATDGISIEFLFLEVLRWFTSLGSPLRHYVFMSRSLDMTPAGLPHSEIPGSKRACRSPRLIAACCVLHRFSVPRHPPSTLSNLTIKCLDLMRSAVSTSISISSCISLSTTRIQLSTNAGSRRSTLNAILRLCPPLILAVSLFHCGFGGADRARTDDPLLAKQVLSQLSYSPGS